MKYSDQIRFVAERLDEDMEGSLVYAIDKLGELTADLRKMKTGEIPLCPIIGGPEAPVEGEEVTAEPALEGAESPETDESNPDFPASEDTEVNVGKLADGRGAEKADDEEPDETPGGNEEDDGDEDDD